MYFLLKMGIFQPAMLNYQRVVWKWLGTMVTWICLVGDFLRILLPGDSSPLYKPPFKECFVGNFFQAS